jgi:hypothetical protein
MFLLSLPDELLLRIVKIYVETNLNDELNSTVATHHESKAIITCRRFRLASLSLTNKRIRRICVPELYCDIVFRPSHTVPSQSLESKLDRDWRAFIKIMTKYSNNRIYIK